MYVINDNDFKGQSWLIKNTILPKGRVCLTNFSYVTVKQMWSRAHLRVSSSVASLRSKVKTWWLYPKGPQSLAYFQLVHQQRHMLSLLKGKGICITQNYSIIDILWCYFYYHNTKGGRWECTMYIISIPQYGQPFWSVEIKNV